MYNFDKEVSLWPPESKKQLFMNMVWISDVFWFSGRYDIAKHLGIPPESKLMDSIVMQYASDMEWDKTDPLQRAYFEAGEARYDLSQVRRSYTNTSMIHTHAEKLVNSQEKKCKRLDDNPSSSSRVKVEFPLWSAFMSSRVAKDFSLIVATKFVSFVGMIA